MKVMYRYAVTLDNVNYEDIGQPERVAIGKAIFFSLKYNATTGSTTGGLGREFVDGIDVVWSVLSCSAEIVAFSI